MLFFILGVVKIILNKKKIKHKVDILTSNSS